MKIRNLLVNGFIVAQILMAGAVSQAAAPELYLGSELKGNYVWCIAMNLAWNEIAEGVLQEKPDLKTKDATALKLLESFNLSPFTRKDLDAESYYIKSGFGQKTVDLINRETKDRFPGKTFSPLTIRLTRQEFVSYAYFLKLVTYPQPFSEASLMFKGTMVEGFYAADSSQRETVRILKYWNDDKFILKLSLKDDGDQLLLAKGFDLRKPAEVMALIDEYGSAKPGQMDSDDIFNMPKIHLTHYREYPELMGTPDRGPFLGNKGYTDYFIRAMYENIKFDLDHKGARVEAEAVIGAQRASLTPKKIKRLTLDKPFWVVMKRKASPNPYLLLGVNNIEIMKKR